MKRSNEEIEFESPPNKKLKSESKMEPIVNNPGLQHIIEMIFFNLDFKDLMNCQLINSSCNQILKNSMFWLKIWRLKKGLSEENQKCWTNAIQMARKWPQKEFYIQSYIKLVIKIGHFVDVPCYIDDKTLKRFTKRSSYSLAIKKKDAGSLQMLAATTENFSSRFFTERWNETQHSSTPSGVANWTPIELAARNGDIDTINVLSPLINWNFTKSNNPFSSLHPITWAVNNGHTNVVKFLAPLMKYPNALDRKLRVTPMYIAAREGHLEIVKILAPLSKNVEGPWRQAKVWATKAIKVATENRRDEIVRILKSYI